MFRFTIRDVLWLMVVVGLALGWSLHYRSMRADAAKARQREEFLTFSLKGANAALEVIAARGSAPPNFPEPNP